MTKTQALYNFYSSFGMEAYPVDSVPEDTVFPWLTYENTIGDFGEQTSIALHLYYHTKSESIPNAKVEEIFQHLGLGGVQIPYDDGSIWIKRGSPFSNSPADQNDPLVKHRIVNLVLEFL